MELPTEYEISADQMAFTIPEAARISRIGKSTLYILMQSGELPYFKIGTSRRIDPADLRALLARHKIAACSDLVDRARVVPS